VFGVCAQPFSVWISAPGYVHFFDPCRADVWCGGLSPRGCGHDQGRTPRAGEYGLAGLKQLSRCLAQFMLTPGPIFSGRIVSIVMASDVDSGGDKGL
jgi:hypothetical protein